VTLCHNRGSIHGEKPHQEAFFAHPRFPLRFPDLLAGWPWLGVLAPFTLIFFWNPLTNSVTTPQYDAIDVHYFSQKDFADHLLQGETVTILWNLLAIWNIAVRR